MLNLQVLEQAFSSISNIGKGTIECDVDGQSVLLMALLPHEEVAVQKYAAVALEENKDALSANTEFLDRFQVGLLSYAVVKVGPLDLRTYEYIETGEKLPNGVAVKIPRHDAVRRMIGGWSRIVRQYLFRKYSELMERIDIDADKLIKYEPVDLDAEIERLADRIKDLRDRKAEQENEKQAKHPFRQQVENFSNRAEAKQEEEVPASPYEEVQQPLPPDPPFQPRQPVIPATMPPPAKVAPQAPSPAVQSASDVLDNIEQAQKDMDSDLEAEIAAENQRLMLARQARQQQQIAPPVVQPQQPIRRPPPHLAVSLDEDTSSLDAVEKLGEMGGQEAYRIGQVPTLSDKAPQARDASRAVVNQSVPKGTENPRFRKG